MNPSKRKRSPQTSTSGESDTKPQQHYFWRHLPEAPPNTLARHRQPWSQEDEETLRQYYTTHGATYTAAILGRTPPAVQAHAFALNIPGFDSARLERAAEEQNGSVVSMPSSGHENAGMQLRFQPTCDQLGRIRRLLGRRSIAEIAEMYGATEQEIRRIAQDDGSLPIPADQPWSRSENAQLRKLWGKYSPAEIGRRLHRSSYAVRKHAAELGINTARRVWTRSDDAVLRKGYGRVPAEAIARQLGRSRGAVAVRAVAIGLSGNRELAPAWTEEQEQQLRELYGTKPVDELARLLGRSIHAIYARAGMLGLANPNWQQWEEELLAELYGTMPVRDIAKYLNRSVGGIRRRVSKLGIGASVTQGWTYWDTKNDKKLRRLFGTMPLDELARATGCPRYRLPYHLRRLGLIEKTVHDWTPEDEEYLRTALQTTSNAEMAAALGRSIGAVHGKLKRMGLHRDNGNRVWTKQEEAYLRRSYPTRPIDEIARTLDRTPTAIKVRAERLKLRRHQVHSTIK